MELTKNQILEKAEAKLGIEKTYYFKTCLEANICPDCGEELNSLRIDINDTTDCRELYCKCGFKHHDNFFSDF